MSQDEKLFGLTEDASSRPSFEVAMRGYDKRQVDHYISERVSEISRLAHERDRATGQIQNLSAQLEQVRAEVTQLRQRSPQVDRASFRHLGPMVDQILALSEKQAEAIAQTSAERVAGHQA